MESDHEHGELFHGPGYSLRLARLGDLLQVEVGGDIDAQAIRIAYWRQIADTARSIGARKLLVTDRKKHKPATPAELAELVILFEDEGPYFERVAVIEPTPEFVPAIEYAEIYGRGVGINVRIFADRSEAERWVRYGSPDD